MSDGSGALPAFVPVRVAGIGVLSAHGRGLAPIVANMRMGRAPVREAAGLGYPAAALPQVSRFPPDSGDRGEAAAVTRLLDVVDQAREAAALGQDTLRLEEVALVVGTSGFLYASSAELYGRSTGAIDDSTPFSVRGPSWGAAIIAEHLQLRGPNVTVTSGCSSSANALLIASEMIGRRRVRRAIVVGAEELSAVTLGGFDSLLLLDPEGCRPFDRDRRGIQIGEGLAAIVLEADDLPKSRASGTEPPAFIRGGANRLDFHHLTGANPDGSIMAEAMRQALLSARVDAADIAAVKTHGTGSADSDRAEAAALHLVFGARLPPLLALKRYLGHTLGACGALEAAALIGCVRDGFLPAAAGFVTLDPELDVAPLTSPARVNGASYLLNFFGFGGNYTSLVLELG